MGDAEGGKPSTPSLPSGLRGLPGLRWMILARHKTLSEAAMEDWRRKLYDSRHGIRFCRIMIRGACCLVASYSTCHITRTLSSAAEACKAYTYAVGSNIRVLNGVA